jgi:predicted DCC family thiol-disulfide oxidoreductase YuxK
MRFAYLADERRQGIHQFSNNIKEVNVTATVQNMATQKPLTVWYDGESKAIVQEIDQLRTIDKQGRVEFRHASAAGFTSESEMGPESWRTRVYACKSDGSFVQGIAALEAAYESIGMGSWFRFCRMPGLEGGTLFSQQFEELKKAA